MRTIHFLSEYETLTVPGWVIDLETFRRWVGSEQVPEKARVSYLNGDVLVDLSREDIFSHVLVKTVMTAEVGSLVDAGSPGLFLGDGVRLSNVKAKFSVRPDALFASQDTLAAGRVKLVDELEHDFGELEGTPDMVLEVVSPTSVKKDTQRLRELYWKAGITEYWLVDARKEPLSFDILRHTARGYVATRKQQGYVRSTVFGKTFRLTQTTSPLGHPDFTLEMR